MKIINFGSCNIDYVYSLDHIVNAGETETSDKLNVFPGGKGLNQSIALARAGAEVYHAGCIGEDGEFLSEILEKAGADVSHLKTVDGKNGHAIIQVSREGENSIFLYPGSNARITKEHVDGVFESFNKGDILLLQNEINNLEYIIRKAHKKGMCIIFNPSPINDIIKKIDFNVLSYIILNEVEAMEISGCSDPKDSLEYFKEHYPKLKVMLTLGKNGCVYTDGEIKVSHPIFEVKAVDTTAAGDTFTGYFVAELARGTKIGEILKIASCASAIAVSRHGAAPSIPEKDEVMALIGKMKVREINEKESIREKIEKYINENIVEASLEELADNMGYSTVYMGSLVKKVTGKSFKKNLQEKRLSLCAELLLDTDLSVGEIIKKIGYENESYFRDMFKNRYGKNPLEYRRGR